MYLIGAGPGDPGLITAKGLKLLQSCDAVLYDNLVPDELIISLPLHVEKHYVGKKAGSHKCSQDEINRLLVTLAGQGKNVARLKGSDPMIFGRGAEEARYLNENGIPFEIVPGVTAGIGASAYSGIPCTDREKASFVTFVTGHKAIEKVTSGVPWEWVAEAKNGTVIIYMGVSEIAEIVRRLIDNGMPAETPAAVIERATFPTQRTFTSPLHRLAHTVEKENIKPPAIFMIGEVVNLQEQLKWFDNRPLSGIRVMVTRPADQAKDMYDALRDLGAEVLPYPTIGTEESVDGKGWQSFDQMVNQNRWLILTSENGVRYFFRQFTKRSDDIRRLSDFKIAAVGYGTARVLEKMNVKADFIPTKATTACLASELPKNVDLSGAGIVRVRGNLGDDSVEKTLAKAGADVLPLQVYRTFHPAWPDGFREKLFAFPPDVVTFTSGSSADGLCSMLTPDEIKAIVRDKVTVSIGPSTSKVIRSHGIKVIIEATEHSVPGIIKEIVNYYKKRS